MLKLFPTRTRVFMIGFPVFGLVQVMYLIWNFGFGPKFWVGWALFTVTNSIICGLVTPWMLRGAENKTKDG